MEDKLDIVTLLILVGVAAIWFGVDYLFTPKSYPNEPPVVPPTIPYFGHVIGLFWHGLPYLDKTSAKAKSPIYTLNMMSGKTYIVTSPELITSVNRNSKTLNFNPFIAELGSRLTNLDAPTMMIMNDNLVGQSGNHGWVSGLHDAANSSMAPGEGLDHMNGVMLDEAARHLQLLDEDPNGGTVDFFRWTRHLFTLCGTKAVYGPHNPFNLKPELEDAFWDFDNDLNMLLVNIMPSVFARKGHRGRQLLYKAFGEYFDNEHYIQSSALTKARFEAGVRNGVDNTNIVRLEVGSMIGVLVNTIPSAFWMFIHVFSDPFLLRDLRNEIRSTSVSVAQDERTGKTTKFLDVNSMKQRCTLLYSTSQEVFRMHSLGATVRTVLSDTILNNQYLLKKDSIVQIPTSVSHFAPSTWGDNVRDFQPRRFLKQQDPTDGKTKKSNIAAGFRPFGGGYHLCPGRHFASTEILSLTAMLILKYDIGPISGSWKDVPRPKQKSLATAVFNPEKDIRVKITKRKEEEDVAWGFSMK